MKYKFVILLLITFLSLSSCYTTRQTYSGNTHQQCIGKSKNEILRAYGVPDKVQDDGVGGSILVYEQLTQTSTLSAKADSHGRSLNSNAAIYNNSGIIDASDSQVGEVSSLHDKDQTSIIKPFCTIYVNAQNVVYDFKSNYGALYKKSKHLKKAATFVTVLTACILIYLHQFLLANSQD